MGDKGQGDFSLLYDSPKQIGTMDSFPVLQLLFCILISMSPLQKIMFKWYNGVFCVIMTSVVSAWNVQLNNSSSSIGDHGQSGPLYLGSRKHARARTHSHTRVDWRMSELNE